MLKEQTANGQRSLLGNWPVAWLKTAVSSYVIPTGAALFLFYAVIMGFSTVNALTGVVSWLVFIVLCVIPAVLHFMSIDELLLRAKGQDGRAVDALAALQHGGLEDLVNLAKTLNPKTK